MMSPTNADEFALQPHASNVSFLSIFHDHVNKIDLGELYGDQTDKKLQEIRDTVDSFCIYENGGEPLFSIPVVGVLLGRKDINSSAVVKRMDSSQRVEVIYEEGGKKVKMQFFTVEGLMLFLYNRSNGNSALAKIWQKTLSAVIRDAFGDLRKISRYMGIIVDENPDLAAEAYSVLVSRDLINSEISLQIENNTLRHAANSLGRDLREAAKVINEKVNETFMAQSQAEFYKRRLEEMKNETVGDENRELLLMKRYMKEYYLIAVKRDMAKKIAPALEFDDEYDDELDMIENSGTASNSCFMFYVAAKKPASKKDIENTRIIGPIYMANHRYHPGAVMAKLKEMAPDLMIFNDKYIYGYYDSYDYVYQATFNSNLQAKHSDNDPKNIAAANLN